MQYKLPCRKDVGKVRIAFEKSWLFSLAIMDLTWICLMNGPPRCVVSYTKHTIEWRCLHLCT